MGGLRLSLSVCQDGDFSGARQAYGALVPTKVCLAPDFAIVFSLRHQSGGKRSTRLKLRFGIFPLIMTL